MITYNNIGYNGRFGNQLFQYASLCGIATFNNFEYGIPYKNNWTDKEYDKFCLPDCFLNLKAKNSDGWITYYEIGEKQFNYDADMFKIPDDTNIKFGYFQSEGYFAHCKKDIKKQFTFRKEIEDRALKLIEPFSSEEIISVHIRLGDYVNNDNHPVCPVEYYIKALEALPKDAIIFVFSDDIEKAKTIFNSFNRKIVYPTSNNKFVDMCMMNKCHYHVIANSSFSWWGAWLGNSKQVIAPLNWFGSARHMPKNWSTIYCPEWIII